jgi:integrase/recombinase XerD
MHKAYLEPDEVRALEDAAKNPRDRLLIRLLWRLGCRISEAIAVRAEDVDFINGTVTILHLKTRVVLCCPECAARLGRAHVFCHKCGTKVLEAQAREQQRRRVRALPIDDGTLGMLLNHIGRGDKATANGPHLIFPISRGQAWRVVRDCARRAGLSPLVNPETGKSRGISPHRLRDAFAVHAVKVDDSGDGLRLLQEHLGHVSFNTTARYRKVSGQEHRQWYEKLWTAVPAPPATASCSAADLTTSA